MSKEERSQLADTVQKVQIWIICGLLTLISGFGGHLYVTMMSDHDAAIQMRAEQQQMRRDIDRHEAILTELKK